jgi:hypothetical protein
VEGLTLAGVRRKLEEESGPIAADVPIIDELIGRDARERLTEVKRGLRSILDLLASRVGAAEFRLSAPLASAGPRSRPHPSRPKPARGRTHPRRSASPRRKRSS